MLKGWAKENHVFNLGTLYSGPTLNLKIWTNRITWVSQIQPKGFILGLGLNIYSSYVAS